MTKSRKYYKALDRFIKRLNNDDKAYFFKGTIINPLKIYNISDAMSKLDLSKEDLLLIYSLNKKVDQPTVVITTKNIHTKERSYPFEKDFFDEHKIDKVSEPHSKLLQSYLDDVLLARNDDLRDLKSLSDKFKNFVNEKEEVDKDYDIDSEFLKILKNEGDKIQLLCEDLNKNKAFSNALNVVLLSNADAIDIKSEHVALNDIIKVFNQIYPFSDSENEIAQLRIKFTLAFLFEKLQGKDMIDSLSLSRINKFVKSDKFDENIEVIKKAQLFNLGDEYKNELLLPSILKRLDDPHFTDAGTFLYRIASLIAKVDDKVNEDEKAILNEINDRITNPKKKIEGVKQVEVDEDETLEDVLAELNQLIGLEDIKSAIQDLTNFLKVQKLREDKGLKSVNNSLHSVFLGPPGTGKTTVARLVSRIYKHLGYLEKGHLVETDRSGMVAGYVGQTALKVDKIVKASINGVLFIDEAYSLAKGNERDFGNEAVETLIKKMEDHRKELVVIVAGYSDEMEAFIESNPGLQSRFNRYFKFDHYRPKELLGIFELFCNKNDFILSPDAKEKMEFIFEKLYEKRHKAFGNGRVARNLFEKIIEYQANRIVKIPKITELILKTIEEEDVPPVNQTVEHYTMFQENDEEV